jgi:hypothetical protein
MSELNRFIHDLSSGDPVLWGAIFCALLVFSLIWSTARKLIVKSLVFVAVAVGAGYLTLQIVGGT